MDSFIQSIGVLFKVVTVEGRPSLDTAPKWAKYLGVTPEGAYHWLSNDSPVEVDNNNNYFPESNKTKFTGHIGTSTQTGSVCKIFR